MSDLDYETPSSVNSVSVVTGCSHTGLKKGGEAVGGALARLRGLRACPAGRTPGGWAAGGDVLAVRSAVLGETVLLAGAAADVGRWVSARPRWRGCVVYRGAELAALVGLSPDEVRLLHAVKRVFGGEVTADES